jgi:hypothetical protein
MQQSRWWLACAGHDTEGAIHRQQIRMFPDGPFGNWSLRRWRFWFGPDGLGPSRLGAEWLHRAWRAIQRWRPMGEPHSFRRRLETEATRTQCSAMHATDC